MKTLYHGFDGLDVTFQCRPDAEVLKALQAMKDEAQALERPIAGAIAGVACEVAPTGAVGYSFRLDTGPDGETWFIANSTKEKGWNIRVSVKSMALAINGYEAIKKRIMARVGMFSDWIISHSIARVDFAVDIEAEDFQINPERVVCHWRATQSQHREQNRQTVKDEAGAAIEIVGNGGKINSVTIGKMPGRQVIIYNKRREVIDRQKVYWWAIWYPGKPIDEVKAKPVWRVEIRSGKRDLKERWNVATFSELEAKLETILTETLNVIRLNAYRQADSNVTRQKVHKLWEVVRKFAAKPFGEGHKVDPVPVIAVTQRQMRERYLAMIAGMAASLSVVCDVPLEKISKLTARDVAKAFRWRARCEPEKFRDTYKRAEGRLRFLKSQPAWNSYPAAA